jgi:hypothetical protein
MEKKINEQLLNSNEKKNHCDINLWRNRNFVTDLLQVWQTGYVNYASKTDQVTVDDLQLLRDHERAKHLHDKARFKNLDKATSKQFRSKVTWMVWSGIFWYGG